MTDLAEVPAPASVILERGRYAIEQAPDGSWFVLRAAPICESCQSCGCGEQQEPIRVQRHIVQLLMMSPDERAGLIKNPMHLLKVLMGGGGENTDPPPPTVWVPPGG